MSTITERFEALANGHISKEQFLDLSLKVRFHDGFVLLKSKTEDGGFVERYADTGQLATFASGSALRKLMGKQ